MRTLLLLAVVPLLWLPPAAESRDGRPGYSYSVQYQGQGQPGKKAPPGSAQRGERSKRAEQDRRQERRLTQEERRELQRDLDRANREIYRR